MAVEIKNEEEQKKRPPRFGLFKRLALLLILAAVAVLVLCFRNYNLSFLYLSPESGEGSANEIGIDTGLSNAYAHITGGLAVLSQDGLKIYDDSGANKLFVQSAVSDPALRTAGAYALGFDRAGTSFIFTKKYEQIYAGQADDVIIGGELNENGWFALVTRKSGYKAVVTVYNNKAQQVYRWFSSERYVLDAAVSMDGKRVAAACFGQKNGDFLSSILFFKLSSEQTLAINDIIESEVLHISYLSNGKLCAILDDRIAFFDTDGQALGEFSYKNNYIEDFSLSNSCAYVLSGSDSSNAKKMLYAVNTDGSVRAQAELSDGVRQISAAGKYLAVLFSDRLVVYTDELNIKAEWTDIESARDVIMRSDGKAMLVGSNSVRILSP